ncbi:type IV pilus modification PilV family protein, partial [Escherichia coli]|uniref:type IV pilus modification PilV family protein n=1 Tax=Escherichia coli TaxID=562 RepID=UPI003CF940E7
MGTNGWIHCHGLRRRPVFRRPRLCCSERRLRFVRRTYAGGRPGGHSMRLTSTHARHAKGFTLIETLVATVVTALGVLGILSL